MRGKKATNRFVDITLIMVVILLTVGLVTLEVKANAVNNKVTTKGIASSTDYVSNQDKVKDNSKKQSAKVTVASKTTSDSVANQTTSANTNAAPAPAQAPVQASEIQVTQLNAIYYAKQSVNVRESNNTNSNILTTLSRNQAIQVTGQTADGWYQVNWWGTTGYVKNEYLSDTQLASSSAGSGQSSNYGNSSSYSNSSSSGVQQSGQAVEQTSSAPTQIGRVHINGNISVDRATYLNNACNYIPSSVLSAFDSLGFKIEIGNYGQSWAGLFNSGTKYIYVENNTSMDLVYVLSHEMGHFVDMLTFDKYESCLSSQTSEFTSIFNEERTNLSPRYSSNYNYYTSDQTEYFAECFSQYILDSGTLSSRNPKSYDYVNRRFNSINSSQVEWVRRCLG